MVEWSQAIQISMIGGSFIFAYIASTIKISERFDNAIKLLFYIFSLLMLVGSTISNYPILNYNDPSLTNETYLGGVLQGVLVGQVGIISLLIILLIVLVIINVIVMLRTRKEEEQYGKPD